MNMIERVARALCVSDVTPPDRPVSCLDNTPLWELHKKAARAAIAAMREPTEDMGEAAVKDHDNHAYHMSSYHCVIEAWRNMIDAALTETKLTTKGE